MTGGEMSQELFYPKQNHEDEPLPITNAYNILNSNQDSYDFGAINEEEEKFNEFFPEDSMPTELRLQNLECGNSSIAFTA